MSQPIDTYGYKECKLVKNECVNQQCSKGSWSSLSETSKERKIGCWSSVRANHAMCVRQAGGDANTLNFCKSSFINEAAKC
mmetsp:Transcript_75241/g.201658  ORF Transcript_75241/g.201658 Transcript_75241/m.201658 type:complete len:81 (-) Transcript_75241:102-344(-)